MDRLTKRTADGLAVLAGIDDGILAGAECAKAALDRLAAYEDTGLDPDDIRYAINHQLEHDRLKELAEADREGRVVVLPCNVGDTVFRIWRAKGREATITSHYMTDLGMVVRWMDKWGITVFPTYEAAVAALDGEVAGHG